MKRIILASGGLDSTALLSMLPKDGNNLILFFNYGQRCLEQERNALNKISKVLNIPVLEKDITNMFYESDSDIINLTHIDISNRKHEIPGRNFIFISIATLQAIQSFPNEVVEIYIGITKVKVDWVGCKKELIDRMNDIAKFLSNGLISVKTPYINIYKEEVFKIFNENSKILRLEDTWSCYYGKNGKPCGKCPACIDIKSLLNINKQKG